MAKKDTKHHGRIVKLLVDASKPYRAQRNLAIILSVVALCIDSFLLPYIISLFLDLVQNNELHTDKVWWIIGAFAIARIFSLIVLWRVVIYLVWKFETAIIRDLYAKVFDKLSHETMFFHSNSFSGSLVSQSSKLVSAAEGFWDSIIYNITPVFLSIVGSIVLLAFICWPYAIFLLILSIVFVLVAYFGSHHIRQLNEAEADADNKIGGHLSDVVSNILVVKSSATEKREAIKFGEVVKNWRDKSLDTMRGVIKFSVSYSSINTFIHIGALIFAVYAAQHDLISIATIYLMITYTASLTHNLYQLDGVMRAYSRVIGDAKAMTDILAKDISLTDHSNNKLAVKKGKIDFRDITFTHDEGAGDTLFTNFSLSVAPGEKVGLVGVSGSGKTTLTKLLLRFADIDSGEITIDNQNVAEVTQTSLRQAIAYVPQEPLLFHRSIIENISYVKPDATKEEIIDSAKKAGVYDFVTKLENGFDTLVGERGVKLSGGQKQRVAIARAILKDAPILILDEATSALDSESEKLIQKSLNVLMEGRTSIVIAHRLSTIAKLDRIVVLEDGKIIEDGTHNELLKNNGRYAKLWQHQSGGFIQGQSEVES